MLSDAEINALFRNAESDRVERKRDFKSTQDRIREAICAFANDFPNHGRPGVIFIGQEDDLTCAKITVDDELLKKLGSMRDDGKLLPFPFMSVQKREIDGCAVAVVIVAPSEQPPVRLDGRCWIRVGPRRALATVEDERRLTEKQIWKNLPFDSQPCPYASLDDLDLVRFETEYVPSATSPEIRRENGRTTEEKLRALRFLSKDGRPNNAALLLFGKDPRSFFPGAYIQFLRINGTLLTDPIIDHKEVGGTIPDQIRQIEELIKLNINKSSIIGGKRRSDSVDYPIEALEQLVRNAVLHRAYSSSTMPSKVYWYSDRVEIYSPGGLFGEVTSETIWRNATAYRNPLIAEGMKNLGLVERFGYGLVRAKKALSDNGNPPLRFEFETTVTLFTVEGRP